MRKADGSDCPGSTGGSPVGDGGLAAAKFFGLGLFGKIVAASCLRSPEGVWLKQEAFA